MKILLSFDHALLHFINHTLACAPLDWLMEIVTFIGRYPWMLLPVWLVWMAKGTKRSRWGGAILIATLLLGDFMVHQWLKPLFARPRPYVELETVRLLFVSKSDLSDFSFPSAHAVNAFNVATLLALLYPRKRWIALFFGIALLTAFSRIYTGAHYPSDVLAGSCLGSFLGALGFFLFRFSTRNWPPHETSAFF